MIAYSYLENAAHFGQSRAEQRSETMMISSKLRDVSVTLVGLSISCVTLQLRKRSATRLL